MKFEDLKNDIKKRAKQHSINDSSHKCFIEEAVGFSQGVDWTLNKLYQLGYLDAIKDVNKDE